MCKLFALSCNRTVKQEIPLNATLIGLLGDGLIIETDEGKFIINEERIKSETDLTYFRKVKEVFEKVDESLNSSVNGGEVYGN